MKQAESKPKLKKYIFTFYFKQKANIANLENIPTRDKENTYP